MARIGGENLQQEYNRGYDFILNTYGAAENIIPGKNTQIILVKGIVIDVDFQVDKNYKLAADQPTFSIYAKIIGEDLDVEHPDLAVQKLYYSPLLPIHNISIPEIGEEILIMRESTEISSRGYYIGRISSASQLNYSGARDYMDSREEGITSPELKYGFSFNVDELRNRKTNESPSDEIKAISIPVTFGDVVQQGRSQTYIRHSFSRSNKKGVLEQGIRGVDQPFYSVENLNPLDPSIGTTSTKNIHFIDSSILNLGPYSLASTLPSDLSQGKKTAADKAMIVNIADELYNISSNQTDTSMYRQVLGEKLIKHQAQTNGLIKTMLDGLTGLTETVQVLLEAFVEHEHALPKIDINLKKEIKFKDVYRTQARVIAGKQQRIVIPAKHINGRTITVPAAGGGYNRVRIPGQTIPGTVRYVQGPNTVIPGKMKTRNITRNINFEQVIGGQEDPRFTFPVRLVSNPDPVQVGTRNETWGEYYKRTGTSYYQTSQTLRETPKRTDIPVYADPPEESESSLGVKTNKVNTEVENLIALFEAQKDRLNDIFTRATDFLSKNQFIN